MALLAGPILGEWAGPRRMIAIAWAFLGVLVVTRSGFGGMHPAAFRLGGRGDLLRALRHLDAPLGRHRSSRTTMAIPSLPGSR